MKSKFYMVGNAHLDPAWQWCWQEGSAEAKATIRSALDRMKEYEDFRFVCSSVSVYEWIEEFDPQMFEEIKQRVSEGRWILVGGMHVQPDCNLPSGEGFARQTLYSQRYFAEKFNKIAKVGYNVDSFGHNAMLPQIYKKSGMDCYVFMRPGLHESDIPYNLFNWEAPDGSVITAYRIPDPYCSNHADMEHLIKSLEISSKDTSDDIDFAFRFYGVGNHGGGPTKRNIDLILQYQKENPEKTVVFSDVSDLFAEVKKKGIEIPSHFGELQHHAVGCYSSVSFIKNAIRRSETEISASEFYSMLACGLIGKKYPTDNIKKAWKNILLLHFHDVAGGCCIRPAYTDMKSFSGEARAIASRSANNALQSISWQIDTSDSRKGTPFIVFNPYPWKYRGTVTINEQANCVTDAAGKEVAYQWIHSPKHCCWQTKNLLLNVEVPPMGYAVYYMNPDRPWRKSWTEDRLSPASFESSVQCGENFIENEYLRVEFDLKTGFITSLFDKRTQKEWMDKKYGGRAAVMHDPYDTWGHDATDFHDYIGCFADAKVSLLENGPVRATIKVESKYGDSVLRQYFSLAAGADRLKVSGLVNWQEKHKMLKIQYPVAVTNPKGYCEIPFGFAEKECNGQEESAQRWIAMSGDDARIAILNDRFYSCSFNGNVMEQTVLRSCLYCDHGNPANDEMEFTEQGEHFFTYEVMPTLKDSWSDVIKAAAELNYEPVNIVENNHEGKLPEYIQGGLFSSLENVIVSAFKLAEDGNGIILRAYETDGKTQTVTFEGSLIQKSLTTEFTPHSVKTFYYSFDKREWREVMLTEFDFE